VSAADQPALAAAKSKCSSRGPNASAAARRQNSCVLERPNAGAFARAAAVLAEEKYRAAAEKNVRFLRGKSLGRKSKSLFHRWRDGERDGVQLLEG